MAMVLMLYKSEWLIFEVMIAICMKQYMTWEYPNLVCDNALTQTYKLIDYCVSITWM